MRASLFCTISVIAAVCAACSAPYMPQPRSQWALTHPSRAQVCSFGDVPLYMITDNNYDPTRLVPPTSSQLTAITSTSSPINTNSREYKDLQSAFSRAPDFFKNQLCELTGVYIVLTGAYVPASWGLRDPRDPS